MTRRLAQFLTERTLQEPASLRFLPSMLAAAAANVALRTKRGAHAWTTHIAAAAGYEQSALGDAIRFICGEGHGVGARATNPLDTCARKYKAQELDCVADTQLAPFPVAPVTPQPSQHRRDANAT